MATTFDTEKAIKNRKFTKDQVFKNEKYIVVELGYGMQFILPQETATILIDCLHKSEMVNSEMYTDDITIQARKTIKINTKAVTKEAYQIAKVKALLMPIEEEAIKE